jgi:predicted GIY-YIG superfamily endonuclease
MSKSTKKASKLKSNEPSRQTLYRFFNAQNELLYVGITNNPFNRFSGHSSDKSWFSEISHATLEHYQNRAAVDRAETNAIKSENPKYNIAKVDGWERSPDHMKKIRNRGWHTLPNHETVFGILTQGWVQKYGFGNELETDCYTLFNAIKVAKTMGHKCSGCDAILKHNGFIQRHNEFRNKLEIDPSYKSRY